MIKKITVLFVYMILTLIVSVPSSGISGEKDLPDSVTKELSYLINFSESEDSVFNSENTAKIVNFVINDNKSELYCSNLKKDRASAFCSYKINVNLKQFIDYLFNPVIPSSVLSPASVRISSWKPVDPKFNLAELKNKFDLLDKPVVVKGTEHTETTPNDSTGGFYSYDLDNTCILFKYKGRTVLVSINKQKNQSTVGHKGYPFGPEKSPYFLYTQDEGLTSFGLGWVSSYVYDSMGISVYVSDGNSVKCGAFNWIYAGWAKNNMAKRDHVYCGIEKYGNNLKSILEDKKLPPSSSIMTSFRKLENMNRKDLIVRVKNFYKKAKARFRNFPEDEYEDKVKIEKYSKPQLVAVLMNEYMRIALGAETVLTRDDIPFLF